MRGFGLLMSLVCCFILLVSPAFSVPITGTITDATPAMLPTAPAVDGLPATLQSAQRFGQCEYGTEIAYAALTRRPEFGGCYDPADKRRCSRLIDHVPRLAGGDASFIM